MSTPQQRIAKILADLWTKNQPLVLERLHLLDEAAQALTTQTLTDQKKELAIQTAHKLAGTLGMFGHPRGTEIARQLEQLYDEDPPNPKQIQPLTQQLHQTLNL